MGLSLCKSKLTFQIYFAATFYLTELRSILHGIQSSLQDVQLQSLQMDMVSCMHIAIYFNFCTHPARPALKKIIFVNCGCLPYIELHIIEYNTIVLATIVRPPSIMLKNLPKMLLGISQIFPLLCLDSFLLCSDYANSNYSCELCIYT